MPRMTPLSFYFTCFFVVVLHSTHDGVEGKHYTVITEKSSWYEGSGKCLAIGGQMATLRNKKDHQQLTNEAKEFLSLCMVGISSFWTAGVRKNGILKKFDWRISDSGVPVKWFHWHQMDPNNHGGHQDCLKLWWIGGDFKMVDDNCSRKACVICELDQ